MNNFNQETIYQFLLREEKKPKYFTVIKYAGKINGSTKMFAFFFESVIFEGDRCTTHFSLSICLHNVNEFGKWILLPLPLTLSMRNARN